MDEVVARCRMETPHRHTAKGVVLWATAEQGGAMRPRAAAGGVMAEPALAKLLVYLVQQVNAVKVAAMQKGLLTSEDLADAGVALDLEVLLADSPIGKAFVSDPPERSEHCTTQQRHEIRPQPASPQPEPGRA